MADANPIPPIADSSWLNAAQRSRDLAAACTGTADLLVIGAGVTGAGAAFDAAARGLSVVLVDAGDIAVGTSSRSGKTFHGGLRYLAQCNFRLVAHAIAERDLMLHTISPHMARPESFVFPLTHALWQRLFVGAGVLLYDLFGLPGGAVPRHSHLGRAALAAHIPSIDSQRVRGAIRYYDALTDDARHTLALVRSAAGLGARVITRAAVTGFVKDGERVAGVLLRDALTGSEQRIAARAIINASGVQADAVQQLAGANTFRVQAAKGVHLLLRPDALQAASGILAPAADSVIIARRWYGYWLVGTTDTPWNGARSHPVAEPADVDYLLENLNRYLAHKLTRADVLGVYAGLRPLLKPVATGAQATSALSRDHAVIDGPPGLTTIVGGKFTTYRRMASDAVDAALRPLGISTPSRTATLPLTGAQDWPAVRGSGALLAQRFKLAPAAAGHLLQRHGDRVRDLIALADAQPALGHPLPGAPQYLAAELVYAVLAEGAQTLADLLLRRTHLALELPDGAIALAPHAAALIAPHLGWNAERVQQELADYRALIAAERAALQDLRAPPDNAAARAGGSAPGELSAAPPGPAPTAPPEPAPAQAPTGTPIQARRQAPPDQAPTQTPTAPPTQTPGRPANKPP